MLRMRCSHRSILNPQLGLGACALIACLMFGVRPSAAHAQSAAAQSATESMAQSTVTDADMTDLQARGHFRLGRELYGQGRFAEAAKEFEVAYGLSGRGQLLYNVYLAYRDAQDTANAARALRGYLAAVPDASDREHLSARLAVLDATLQQSQAEAASREAAAATAKQEAVQAERQRAASEQRAVEAEKRAQQRPSRPWWPWLVVGGGLAATGTGLVLGSVATSAADKLRGDCVADPRTVGATAPLVRGSSCAPSVNLSSRRSSIKTEAALGDAMWIGGSVIAVVGLVLVFALPDQYPDLERSPVTASCSARDCTASLHLTF